jgi:hypothetical protein
VETAVLLVRAPYVDAPRLKPGLCSRGPHPPQRLAANR